MVKPDQASPRIEEWKGIFDEVLKDAPWAPVFNEKNHVVAAISVMSPLIRLTPEREKEIIQDLVQTSKDASASLQ